MAVLIVLFGGWAVPALYSGSHVCVYWSGSLQQKEIRTGAMVTGIFPRPLWIIYITGVLEFLGSVFMLLARTRFLAAICLMLLLAASSRPCSRPTSKQPFDV
jgi:hypothetical protein